MTRVTDDLTAGRRAQQIHETPDVALPIMDPTDPRYGQRPTDPARRRQVEETDREIRGNEDAR
jgi:hypothetical protein